MADEADAGPRVALRDLRKDFGKLQVLKGIDLEIATAEVVCIIGPSGSGKSTLLRCVNLLEVPTGGRVEIDGVDITGKKVDIDDIRTRVGMVFQSFNLFPHMTVLENVTLAPRKVLKLARREATAIALKQLAHVGLSDKQDVYPSRLSGGQQQRMAIARALAMSPSCMLFDEVTSALDPQLVGEVLDTLRLLSREGMTMIVVTHEMRFAREVSDRVAFFYQGKVHEIGPPAQIFDAPEQPATAVFLKAVL